MSKNQSSGFLGGVKILDISEGIAAPFCTKLLSDLGAEVVKIEKPTIGDRSRALGPFPDGEEHLEKSPFFFFLNTGKKSIEIDIDSSEGRDYLAGLVQEFDVIVSSDTSESLEDRGLSFEQFHAWNKRTILTTVSGFGSFGPYSQYRSSHIVSCAVGGWAESCGVPDREPLQAGGNVTETLTGAYAAVATLIAIYGRNKHGSGEHVDVSAQEATLAGAQLPTLFYEYRNLVLGRYSSVGSGAGGAFMLPTREGYIGLNALTAAQRVLLCQFLGRQDIADDPNWDGVAWMNPDDRIEQLREIYREALEDRSAEELFHEAAAWRVPFGLVPSLTDLPKLTPHVERDFYSEVTHPVAGKVSVPGVPFKSTVSDFTIERPPLLGEHTEQILENVDLIETDENAPDPISITNELALSGLKVLDLSMFFAGPVCAQILADAGADVVKVESVQRIDGWRGSGTAAGLVTEGPIAPWESSPYFNWVNRSKRDITLNLTDPRGADIIKQMVKDADVLIENYTPRVMNNFGLSYEVLRELNPNLIMISLSGFGADNSWKDYVAFGMSTEQLSGVSHLTGYPDDEPLFTGMTGGDLYSGVMGAWALLSALYHRTRTGEGQHIDFSQIEACNLYLGDMMTASSMSEYDPGRLGNDRHGVRLQGIFPCLDDRWIAITCENDQELDVLMRAAHIEGLAPHGIEEAIKEWTKSQSHIALMEELQSLGISAGAVLNGPELLEDRQLQARDSFMLQNRPGLGTKHYPGQPYRFLLSKEGPNIRAPLLGEHTREVLQERLDLSQSEIDALTDEDVIGTVPIAAR